MALVVGGVTVTGTQTLDASKLTGTASAINGSNITSLPAPSSANVATATAGVSALASGTYALLSNNTDNQGTGAGTTRAGSQLSPTNTNNNKDSATCSGTWRCMGYSLSSTHVSAKATLWLRIS